MTKRRKLLTAAVGVATVSYVVACGGIGGGETSGNLVAAGGSYGYGGAETSGNLVAAGGSQMATAGSGGTGYGGGETSGNLVAPPPAFDAGTGGAAPVPDSGTPPPDSGVSPSDSGAPADAAAAVGDADVD